MPGATAVSRKRHGSASCRPAAPWPHALATAHPSGFTLLEIIITLALLGLLIAGLSQAAHLGAISARRQAQVEDSRVDLDAIDGTLRRLIGHAQPGSEWEPLAFIGTDRAVAFTSIAPLPHEPALAPRADIRLDVDPRHRLVLAWAPHIHARAIQPAPPLTMAPLLEGVARLDLAYWPARPGGGWTSAWSSQQPPRLVRIRIVFADAARPAWPDLVVASNLDPP